jgi:hypothetical protein
LKEESKAAANNHWRRRGFQPRVVSAHVSASESEQASRIDQAAARLNFTVSRQYQDDLEFKIEAYYHLVKSFSFELQVNAQAYLAKTANFRVTG